MLVKWALIPVFHVLPLPMAETNMKIYPLDPFRLQAKRIFETGSILPDIVEFGLKLPWAPFWELSDSPKTQP